MKSALLCLALLINTCLIAQESSSNELNPRVERPTGINGALGGPALTFALSVNHFVSPSVDIEFGIGAAIYGGMKYHLGGQKPTKKWTPYLGIYGT